MCASPQDLEDILSLMDQFTQHQPALVPDLMALNVELASAPSAKRSWLDVALGTLAVMSQLTAASAAAAPGASAPQPQPVMGHALALLTAIAHHHPTRTLQGLQTLPLMSVNPLQLPDNMPLTSLPSLHPTDGGG